MRAFMPTTASRAWCASTVTARAISAASCRRWMVLRLPRRTPPMTCRPRPIRMPPGVPAGRARERPVRVRQQRPAAAPAAAREVRRRGRVAVVWAGRAAGVAHRAERAEAAAAASGARPGESAGPVAAARPVRARRVALRVGQARPVRVARHRTPEAASAERPRVRRTHPLDAIAAPSPWVPSFAPEELPRVVLEIPEHLLDVVVERLVHHQRADRALATLDVGDQ